MNLKVVKNQRCLRCKRHTAERIKVFDDFNNIFLTGNDCWYCGYKKKIDINKDNRVLKLL